MPGRVPGQLSGALWAARLPWRIALTALALAYLAAAFANGFDRASLASTTSASGVSGPAEPGRLVPPPFRARLEMVSAGRALADGNGQAALAHARLAVLADPVDSGALGILGSVRQITGDNRGALAAFRVGALLGWREQITQLYWYDAALAAGDYRHASQRLDALLRTDRDFADAPRLLAPLEASPEGRAALAARLAEHPDWLGNYMQGWPGEPSGAVLRRSEVVMQLARSGTKLGCTAPRIFTEQLLAQGARRDAVKLWRAHCDPDLTLGGIVDGGLEKLGLEKLGDDASPFGWKRRSAADVSARFTQLASGGRALSIENRASVSRLLLFQQLYLAPGRYRLQADVGGPGADNAARVFASLNCGAEPMRPRVMAGRPGTKGQMVEAPDCAGQVLGIWLIPGSGSVTLGNIRIKPAP